MLTVSYETPAQKFKEVRKRRAFRGGRYGRAAGRAWVHWHYNLAYGKKRGLSKPQKKSVTLKRRPPPSEGGRTADYR
jgi:hypothetical protein